MKADFKNVGQIELEGINKFQVNRLHFITSFR